MNKSLITIILWTIFWVFAIFAALWIDYYFTKYKMLNSDAPWILNYNWFQIVKIKQEDIKQITLAANTKKINFDKIFAYQNKFFTIPKLDCNINIWSWDINRNYIMDLSTYELEKKQKEAMEKRIIRK